MPDLEISRLPQLAGADLQGTDPIAVADISASETKKLTVADLLTFGVTFIGSNSISGDQIISLDGGKLLPDSVTAREIAPDAIGSSELADLSVDTAAIQDGAVTNVKLASGIDGSKILALSIGNAQIIDLDGSKILSGTISTDQLGADCITAVQLANNSVDTAAVQNGAITNDKLAVNIDGSKILPNSITSLELAPNSVGSSELADSSVDTAAIQNAAVTNDKLASGISGSKIVDGSIPDAKISSLDGAKLFGDSVTANEIAPNSIGSSELSDASVDTAAVQNGAITDDKLASGIDGGKISSASITNVQLGPGSVTNPAIRDGAVTNAKITGPIDASKLSSGSIPDTALGNVTDRGLDQSTGKIGIANTVIAGTQSGISWDEKGLITGASGSVPPGDLPVATDATPGVVSVPSEGGLAVDVTGALSIANAITAATKQGITYDKHGSIINVSDTIPVASIPLATNSTIGGVKVPGPDVTVSIDGALTLGDSGVTAGTYPKVTVNSKGVVTAGTNLAASDIPDLDADKITSGNLDGSFIADRSIQQIKLADNSTCYIQEARPSVDTAANYKGCLWYQESTAQLRIYNGNSWNAVGFGRLSQDNLRWGGIVNATTGLIVTLTDAGQTAQLIVGAALPTASDALGGLYMVTDPGGNGIGVTSGITYDAGDWVLCINAAEGWTRIDTMASGGGGGGASSLDQLTDVTITAPANGEILVYNDSNGQWENEPQAVESVSSVFGRTGDVVATNGDYDLGELGDVDLTSVAAATGDVLQYDGAEWTPINLAGTVPITSVGAGAGLTDSGSGTDVVLNVGSGTGITVNTDDIEINRTVVDSWYIDVSGDTMTGPLVLSGDPTTNNQAANKKYVDDVAADAVIAGDAKYVEVAGDDMTGNLTLGTDKITLNATDGSITAANAITSGAYDTSDALAGGSRLLSGGRIDIQRASTENSTSSLIQGYYATDRAFLVRADGSSEFAGDMAIGTTGSFTPSTPAISLKANGTIDAVGAISTDSLFNLRTPGKSAKINLTGTELEINTLYGSDLSFKFATSGATATERIRFDNSGSASFAGDISVGSSASTTNKLISLTNDVGSTVIGTRKTTYRNIDPGDGYLYSASKNLCLLADSTSGEIRFAANGESVGVRIKAGSVTTFGGTTSVPNVTIDGSDGSAEFAGVIQSGGDASATTAQTGAVITPGGRLYLSRENSGSVKVLVIRGTGTTTDAISLSADGSGRFTGDVTYGGTSSSPNIALNADGTVTGVSRATFYDYIADVNDDGHKAFRVKGASDTENLTITGDGTVRIGGTIPASPKIALNATDGSASFAGQVSVGADAFGVNNTGSGLTPTGSVIARRAGSGNLWLGYQEGTTQQTSQIAADGSASFGFTNTKGIASTRVSDGDLVWQGIKSGTGATSSISADGKAVFADNVSTTNGVFSSTRSSSSGYVLIGRTGTTDGINITADGTTKIGGALPNLPNIELNSLGTVTLKDKLVIRQDGGGGDAYIVGVGNSGDVRFSLARNGTVKIGGTANIGSTTSNISLNTDGSSEFAGTLQVDGSFDNEYALRLKNSSSTNPSGVLIDLPNAGAAVTPAIRVKVAGGVDTTLINTDGSASFAGNILARTGGATPSATQVGSMLWKGLKLSNDAANPSTTDIIESFSTTLGTKTFSVAVDGSAKAAGGKTEILSSGSVRVTRSDGGSALVVKETVGGNTNAALSCSGTLRLNNDLQIGNSIAQDASRKPNIELNSDGTVTALTFNIDALPSLP